MKYSIFLAVLFIWGASVNAKARPNVLFLAIDDLNDWIGCLGGHPQVKTPNLDKLAKRGTLFINAHCQAPVCNPSRTSVLLGLRPSTTGIYSLQPSFKKVPKYANHVTIPKAFKLNGYATSTMGKIYHSALPKGEFDKAGSRPSLPNRFPDEKLVKTPQNHKLVDWGIWPPKDSDQLDYKTADWAVNELSQKPKGPFFMAVGFFRPHVPLYASQKWFDLYPEDFLVLPPIRRDDRKDTPRFSWYLHWELPEPRLKFLDESKQLKNKVRSYLASVSFVDSQVGRVLDALKESGLEDNTIIVCWSDHGYHLGEKEITGKNTLWDPTARVPLMFAGPGISKGARCGRPAELLDIYPTLAELCGLKSVPKEIEGLSLVAQLKDAKAPRSRPAITSHGPGNDSARSETHRYIRYADGSEELYDIRKDPHEFKNLASDPKTKKIRSKLASYLPKTPAKPVAGSNARLIERKKDGSVYWQNALIEKDAKIPEYE
jgi:arylsulfatase A-like enzyme